MVDALRTFRIQAGWSYETGAHKISFINGLMRTKVTINANCAEYAKVTLVNLLYRGGSFCVLAKKMEDLLKTVTEVQCTEALYKLLDNKVLIEGKPLEDDKVINRKFDRLGRFFNTFEDANRSGEDLLNEFQWGGVLIVGLGSYGSVIAEALVRMGIKRLISFDHDVVEESNLDRQSIYVAKDVGRKKVAAANEALSRIGSGTILDLYDQKVCLKEDLTFAVKEARLVVNTFGYLDQRHPAHKVSSVIAGTSYDMNVPCLTLGGSNLGPLWRPGHKGCHFCFFRLFEETKGLFHPDRRSPLTQKRMCYPISAALAHQAVWEICSFLSGAIRPRILGRVMRFDWFNQAPVTWIDLPRSFHCERCT